MICVDRLRAWPHGPAIFRAGAAHLFDTADDRAALDAFAARLGLRREWFQPHRLVPHYDLTKRRYWQALALGARPVDMKAEIRRRRSLDNAAHRGIPAP